jgi:VanZ family protein
MRVKTHVSPASTVKRTAMNREDQKWCELDRPGPEGENPPATMVDFLWYWLPPVSWCIAIFTLSSDLGSSRNTFELLAWLSSWFLHLSPATLDFLNAVGRKIGHMIAYGFCYFWWFRALHGEAGMRPGRACGWAMALCLMMASLDEGHQRFFGSRTGTIWDVALDMTGALLASFLTLVFWRPGPNRLAGSLSTDPAKKPRML